MKTFNPIATINSVRDTVAEHPITKTFIWSHAQILKDFGGKRLIKEYAAFLTQFKDNPVKFDYEFAKLRDAIMAYKEEV